MSHWYEPLVNHLSAGQLAAKATCLADLHARREAHQGQFFTPTAVASLMWDLARAAFGKHADAGLRIFDNSIGSGRLVQFAGECDSVHGADVDAVTLQALDLAMTAGGISHDLEGLGMESVRASGMDVAIINPPFSLHLESPTLEPFDCCTFGRFGPTSSAISHWYALYQAIYASRAVIALLPASVLDQLQDHPKIVSRLYSVTRLPADAFASEGANVATVILCMGAPQTTPMRVTVDGIDAARAQVRGLAPVPFERSQGSARLSTVGVDTGAPAITGEVTGDERVRIYRAGRRIKLGFFCAFTHARVINAVLEERLGIENHLQQRYPKGIEFMGSARLLVEVLLCGKTPFEYLDRLCAIIRAAGGIPEPDAHLLGYLRRRWRDVQVEKTPLQRTIYDPHGQHGRSTLDGAEVKVRKHHLTDPKAFSAPMARAGQTVTLVRADDREQERYRYSVAPAMPPLSTDELAQLVELPAVSPAHGAWRQIEAGRAAAFPARAAAIDRRLSAAGADAWLGSWLFQRLDVVELSLARGAIGGHMMALGKSRMAAGCCLAGGRHNAIVVEAGLIDEMLAQFRSFGLDPSLYQELRTLEDTRNLKRINVVSYSALRQRLGRGSPRTLASVLRRRFHTVCADEGSLLSHTDTQQTQALYQLSARRRIAFDGTPIPNLPRNLLPLVCWTSREGTASQPYGAGHPYVEGALFASAYRAERGIDRFREQFVVTEWISHEFCDSLTTGAKREIPSLANLDLYREFVGRHVLRRVWGEPAVAAHVTMPDPEKHIEEIDWDAEHLEHYVGTCEEWVEWYRRSRPEIESRRMNLMVVLLRLNAACRASSIPQDLKGPHAWGGGLTSKQRWCVDALSGLDDEGTPSLCYFESPLNAALIAAQLRAQGRHVVEYTGLRSRKQRAADLARFRSGECRIMLMTYGVGARGLNIPMADHILLFDRMWSPRQEMQAIFRALRVGRKGVLQVTYAHLLGSIDEYRAQMVAFKADTAAAGLDFATPEFVPSDFQHWLAILDGFAESIGRKRLELVRANRRAA